MEVIKRDGRQSKFDQNKIITALEQAFKAVDKELTEENKIKIQNIADSVSKINKAIITVEEIQDLIENKLMASNRKDVAKAYIIYRNNRNIEREKKSAVIKKVVKRINAANVENSNANVDERSFSGREKEAASDVSKTIALEYGGLSKDVAKAHKTMLIYQHDLEKAIYGQHNCVAEFDWITYRNHKGIAKTIQFKELANIYPLQNDMPYQLTEYAEVLGRNGWTKLEGITKRKLGKEEPLYEIKLYSGLPINLTGNHRVPIICNGKEELVYVKDLCVGDEMLTIRDIPVDITNQDEGYINLFNIYNKIKKINIKYTDCEVYDLQTASHWFVSNDIVVHNCLFLNFDELFKNGFKTRNGDVRPPSSFSTACQLVAVAFQCQSQVQFGGVGTIHIDYDLAPFVKMSFCKHLINGFKYLVDEKDITQEVKDLLKTKSVDVDNEYIKENYPKVYEYAMDMLETEGKQAAEGLYHNLNTLESRQGSQVPFTSINTGRDTSTEGRMVTRWIFNASLNGIGKHHLTSIFPISIMQYKEGVNANPGDVNYDLKQLALKSMSKRIYPNWCNCNWSQAHETEDDPSTYFATMGCRTLIGYDRHGLGYTRQGRGNNVPNTIILPKLGIEYGICLGKRETADLDGFWKALNKTLKLCEKGLLERYEIIKKQSPKAAPFMYENHTMQGTRECTDTVENAVKHNTLGIGLIGIAEMCVALFGKNHAEDKKVHEFALKVVETIYNYAKEASERNNLNFGCYFTPAEGLCRTALVSLREQYGVIENVTSREYLTNSCHVPVWQEISIYDKLRVEAPFTKYATSGCITYVELESTFMNNTKAIEDIIDYAFKELDIPYLAFNFPIDSCLDCGYQSEFNDKCPMCGSTNIQQLRRVTGYLTTDYTHFNDGKIAEVKDRVKHTKYTNFAEK